MARPVISSSVARPGALPDHARQQAAGAHVGPGQAHAGEEVGRLGRRRAQAHVSGQGDHGASPRADAVDSGHDGLRRPLHRLDQVTRHAREAQQLGHGHLGQRLDDLEDVTARAEITALPCNHHGAHVTGVGQVAEQVAQFGVTVEGQRVLFLRPVELDRGHSAIVAALPVEVASGVVLEGSFVLVHGVSLQPVFRRSSGGVQVGPAAAERFRLVSNWLRPER
jgi:hypothetical protein